MKKPFLSIFKNEKPIFAMIHLKGDQPDEIYERALKEIAIYEEGHVDAIIIENYFGTYEDMKKVLAYLQSNKPHLIYGVNCLNVDPMGFYLAKTYGASFVQFDSVAGHLKQRDESAFKAFIDMNRNDYDGYVLGGVRFKYQPYLSGRSLAEDLKIGMSNCDAIVVTQDATGQETSMDKIEEFRSLIGDFPLVVGAGMTPENCEKQFAIADAAIVGSYFKDTYKDTGDVDKNHVLKMMDAVSKIRGKGGKL